MDVSHHDDLAAAGDPAGDAEQTGREQARAREMVRDGEAAAAQRALEHATHDTAVDGRRVTPQESAAQAIADDLLQLGVTHGGEIPSPHDDGETGPEYETTLDVARQIAGKVLEHAAARSTEYAKQIGQSAAARISGTLDAETAALVSVELTDHERTALPSRIAKLTAALLALREIQAYDDTAAAQRFGLHPETRKELERAGHRLARVAVAVSQIRQEQVRMVTSSDPELTTTGGTVLADIWPRGFEDIDPGSLQRSAAILTKLASDHDGGRA